MTINILSLPIHETDNAFPFKSSFLFLSSRISRLVLNWLPFILFTLQFSFLTHNTIYTLWWLVLKSYCSLYFVWQFIAALANKSSFSFLGVCLSPDLTSVSFCIHVSSLLPFFLALFLINANFSPPQITIIWWVQLYTDFLLVRMWYIRIHSDSPCLLNWTLCVDSLVWSLCVKGFCLDSISII